MITAATDLLPSDQLSTYQATRPDKATVVNLLEQTLKPLFGCEEWRVLLLNESGTLTQWAISHPLLNSIPPVAYSSAWKELIDQLARSSEPITVDSEKLAGDYADLLKDVQQAHIAKLALDGRVLGILLLGYQQPASLLPRQRSMLRMLADLLAVSVANILASEEILQREREKSILLSVSEAIALIRHKEDLFAVIMNQVKPLLGFSNDAVFFVLEPDGNHYRLLFNHSPALHNHQHQQVLPKQFPLDPFAQELLYSPGPLLLQTTDYLNKYPGHWGLQAMQQQGIQQAMTCPLKVGNRVIGTLNVHSSSDNTFSRSQFPLYESLSNQVAVAVANILANEEILEREREKALELALINALVEGKDWEEKCFHTVKTLQPSIPFEYVVIGLMNTQQEGRSFGFERLGHEEYRTIRTDDWLRMTGLKKEQYDQLRRQIVYPKPLLLNQDTFQAHCRQFPLKQLIADTFRLQANLVFPLSLSRQGQYVLSFYSRQPNTYQPHHVALLERIQRSLVLTLEKLMAFEEIEQLSQQLQRDNSYLQAEVNANYNFEEMIGGSPAMQAVFGYIAQVAPTNATVLILGETGTGKELIARAIHNQSPRQGRVMIKLNCATLPAQLIESELFGHEKGSFTGAFEKRMGKFELANGGTIFLDEIGEIPLELQAKLLRVLQEREYERIGGKSVIKTNVRVIAATNRDLQHEVAEGRFRADLYYRLSVFPIHLPPLRERREDIPMLAYHFGQRVARSMNRPFVGIQEAALQELLRYDWPGNIRELENLIEQAVILCPNQLLSWGRSLTNRPSQSVILFKDDQLIGEPVDPERERIFAMLRQTRGKILGTDGAAQQLGMRPAKLEDYEREFILEALRAAGGKVRGTGGAAELIGMKANALDARITKLGIRREHIYRNKTD